MMYTFMNKNIELFDVEFESGLAMGISNIREDKSHLLPVFIIPSKNMSVSRKDFNEWWRNRRIPASRGGIKQLFWHLNNISLDELAEKALGLSLSDQYWIRPNSQVKWDDVNFFTNPFSDDIGNLLITGDWNGNSLVSPDNTSDGTIKKRWKIIDGVRCLLKGSTGVPWQAEPFREKLAAKVAFSLFSPFDANFVVPYDLVWDDDKEFVYSSCPNFITVDTEYVSFNQILASHKRPNHISPFSFCRSFYSKQLYVIDLMILLDYIVLNEDRHFGNFGMIRDTNTGKWLQPAPVFDSGTSLFHSSPRVSISKLESKPFNKDFNVQVKLVDTMLYYDSLKEVQIKIEDIFFDSFADCFEDEERKSAMLTVLKARIKSLLQHMN